MKKHGLKSGTASWFAVLALPLCVLGARLGYCLVYLPWLIDNGLMSFFDLPNGGFILYGALLGGAAAGALTACITKQSFGRIADAVAVPAALTIALSRLAEGLAGEGYGRSIETWFDGESGMSLFMLEDPSFFYRFPFAVKDYYDEYKWAVFVLEALVALVITVILLRTADGRPGWKALKGLMLYAAAQILCESLRFDSFIRYGFVKMNQVFSAIVMLITFFLCWRAQRGKDAEKKSATILRLAATFVLAGIVMAMEFALEEKIEMLVGMKMDVCYFVMMLSCIGLYFVQYPLWKRSQKVSV